LKLSEYTTGADGAGDASMASQAQEKVQQTAQQASHTAARYVREQTETRSKQLAGELQDLAGALRRSSHSLHADGKSSTATGIESVVDRIEGLGRYLGQTGGDQMLRDIESFGRRKPWGMIGVGLGLGVAASRFLKASSSRRFDEEQPQFRPQRSPQQSTVPAARTLATASAGDGSRGE
jgi:ElaB/YqjD/DUF883 family membrane-anchored ribosome-binding protein